MHKKQWPLILLLSVTLVVYHQWIFTLNIFYYGDWGVNLTTDFVREYTRNFFIWSLYGSGLVDVAGGSSYFLNFVRGLLTFVTPHVTRIDRIFFYVPTAILPLLCGYALLRVIVKNKMAAVVGALAFGFNTYILFLTSGGHLLFVVAISISALILRQLHIIIHAQTMTWHHTVILSFLLFIMGIYEFRFFYMLMLILGIYGILFQQEIMLLKRKYLLLIPFVSTILLNMHWIIPLSFMGEITSNYAFDRPLFGQEFMQIDRAITFFHPYWTGGRVVAFVIQNIHWQFFLIPIIAFTGVLLQRKNKIVMYFTVVALLGIFLTKQNNPPFADTYPWLFAYFPGFNAFREASKFYFYITLGYTVLIAACIDWLLTYWRASRLREIMTYGITVSTAVLFLWNTKPILTTEIGGLFVSRNMPNDYLIYQNFILQQTGYFRTLWIPTLSRWAPFGNRHPFLNGEHIIDDIWNSLAKKGGLDPWHSKESLMHIYKQPFSETLLDVSSIRYVIIPLQDGSNDDDFFERYDNERDYFIKELDMTPWLNKIDIDTEELVVYENKDYRPHIYLTEEKETIHKDIPFSRITHNAVNPTEYTVTIPELNHPMYLNFSESYHPDWRMRVGSFSWWDALWDGEYFLPEDIHHQNDAQLNSFKLSPEDVCGEPTCEDVNPTLFFKAQSYTYLGSIISGTTLIILIGSGAYLVMRQFRSRRRKKDV